MSCGGRTKLPTWVVRMRLPVDAIVALPRSRLPPLSPYHPRSGEAAMVRTLQGGADRKRIGPWPSKVALRLGAEAARGLTASSCRDCWAWAALLERAVDLVVILFHQLDIAGKLNRLRRLQRFVEFLQHFLLFPRGHGLVGGDLRDLLLDRGGGFRERLGLRIDAGHHHRDVPNHLVVIVEILEAMLFGGGIELGHDGCG